MPDGRSGNPSNPAKIVEEQMKKWELGRPRARHLRGQPSASREEEIHDFITIANDVGGGGGDVGALLGERLGWPVFDREILTAMANEDALRTRLYQAMDERDMSWVEETARSVLHDNFHKNDYFHRLTETLYCLARQGPAVFVGRASDLILPKSKGLRVKVIVSEQRRIQNFAEHNGLSPKEAARQIERINRDRANFIYKHFHLDLNEPTRFDLLINLERFTASQTVDVILAAARIRGVKLPRHTGQQS